ncbi:MAG: serine hydrolase [Pseudomonadota bacterium]
MKKILLAAGILLAAASQPALAESAEEQLASRFRALETIIDLRLARESVPGVAVGIVYDQQLIWSHQYGIESRRTKNPISDDTVFSICSISKLFNGVAAMSLVDAGQLDLDSSLFDYIGDHAPADNTDSETPATLRNVLSHVSGLPREGVDDFWADTGFPDVNALRESSSQHQLLYQPYQHWQYSNLGMALVGDVIATVSDSAWGAYVEETILQPLGMKNTTTDMPFDIVGDGFARGHFVRDSKGWRNPVPEHQFRAYAPAAGMASSINDMAKFAAWHFRLRAAGGQEILKAATLKQMQRVHWVGPDFDEPAWGLAYATRRNGGKTLWGHGGYCPGTRADFVMRLPDKTAYIAMMTANDVAPSTYTSMAFDFVNALVGEVYGEDDALESEKMTTSADPDDLDLSEYEGHYRVPNYDWDFYAVIGDGKLHLIPIYGRDIAGSVDTLIHREADTFYRERKDGSAGEPVIFERDDDGEIVSVTQHSYRYTKQ